MNQNSDKDRIAFNRSKIYEQLQYVKAPANFSSKIPWTVQLQIAATNGIQYADVVGKLSEYPRFELPVSTINGDKLMLDIGCGWGRWLEAGSAKGYIPVGIDIRLEFCQTALSVLKDQNVKGYAIVADLENIPFQDNIFDLVWSFSVIQHTHKERMMNCLMHINRILKNDGYTYLEFPNKNGFRNKRGPVKRNPKTENDFNSWVVRYYSISEYQEIFESYLSNFSYDVHSFLGIGVLKEDLKYVSLKNKILCGISLILTELSKIIAPLKNYADSLYIRAEKRQATNLDFFPMIDLFVKAHKQNPFDNLNITHLLKCPIHGTTLELSSDRKKLLSKETGIYYPIENDIPILIESEARNL